MPQIKHHDAFFFHPQCYDDGVPKGCSVMDEYFCTYKWSKVDGQVLSDTNDTFYTAVVDLRG